MTLPLTRSRFQLTWATRRWFCWVWETGPQRRNGGLYFHAPGQQGLQAGPVPSGDPDEFVRSAHAEKKN